MKDRLGKVPRLGAALDVLTFSAPGNVADLLPGMPFELDNAIYWPPSESIYVFSGERYARWTMLKSAMSEGYPYATAPNWPGLNFQSIDASLFWAETQNAYFFSGNQYVRYNVERNQVDEGYPKVINEYTWPGISEHFDAIDAAFSTKGKSYFFRGNQYIRYDNQLDRADPGYPKPIKGNWYGLEFDTIDDVIAISDYNIIFISKGQYDRWVLEKDIP